MPQSPPGTSAAPPQFDAQGSGQQQPPSTPNTQGAGGASGAEVAPGKGRGKRAAVSASTAAQGQGLGPASGAKAQGGGRGAKAQAHPAQLMSLSHPRVSEVWSHFFSVSVSATEQPA